MPGVTPAGQTSELLRLQSENALLKGKPALLEDQMAERDAQLVAMFGVPRRYLYETPP